MVRSVALTAIALPLFMAADVRAQYVSFSEARTLPLIFRNGGGVNGIAKADFDGDGKLDVAVTQTTSMPNVGEQPFVSVLLGNGDGTFGGPLNISVFDPQAAATAVGIVARDFDGDGKVDLVVGIYEQKKVLFFKGNRDGTFEKPISSDVQMRAEDVQAEDLDGDGKLDLVVMSNVDTGIVIMRGNGDGTFSFVEQVSTSAGPRVFAISDINGDGKPDIEIATYDGHGLDVLVNSANGFPAAPTTYATGMDALALYVADFDGDGKKDVVISGYDYGDGFIVIKGNGDGTFQLPDPSTAPRHLTEDGPRVFHCTPEAVDLNGDGIPDVLFGHPQNWVTSAFADGKGGFQVREFVASNGPGFNRDARGNVVNSDGNGPVTLVTGDFNGDGIPDIIAGQPNSGSGSVSILLGKGGGKFEAPRSFATAPVPDGAYDERGLAVGDFNGDGKLDVIVTTEAPDANNNVDVADFLPGNGDGTLGAHVLSVGHYYGLGTNLQVMRAADLDGDGKADLVFGVQASGVQGNGGTPGIRIARGNGDGTFTNVTGFDLGDPNWVSINVAIGDFNGDGIPDIAVLVQRYATFGDAGYHYEIYLQKPVGTFTRSFGFPDSDLGNNQAGPGFAAIDLDGDGKLDIVAHGSGPADHSAEEKIRIFKANGDGTFGAERVVGSVTVQPAPASAQMYRAADLNGDRRKDLVVGGYNVSVYLQNADGSFQTPLTFANGVGGGVTQVALGDLDGDGKPDIAFAMQAGNGGATVLLNRGDGTFYQSPDFAVGAGVGTLAVGDFNGDGKNDLLISHGISNRAEGNRLTILLNNTTAPQITSALNVATTVGHLFTYQVSATNHPNTVTAEPLPPGLSFDPQNAIISGVPQTAGLYNINITAANGAGATSATLVVTVQDRPTAGPVITSGTSETARSGQPFSYQIYASNTTPDARLSVTGLPPKLTFDPVTGVISGTAMQDGNFNVTLTIDDDALSTSETLQLTFVSDAAVPVITSAGAVFLPKDQAFSYTVTAPAAVDASDVTIFKLIGVLPPGLTFDAPTGTISGTYTARAERDNRSTKTSALNDTPVVTNVQLVANNSQGSATKTLTFLQANGDPILNISTRLQVLGGENVLIGGFIITGQDSKNVLVRGIGPSLAAAGVNGALGDPTLELHDATSALLQFDDNWKDTQQAAIQATTIPPTSDLESAIVRTIAPGAYTAIVAGSDDGAGVGLVEIYDLSPAAAASLANISTRGFVDVGENVMIGGFIVGAGGTRPAKVMVRGLGPSLAAAGVNGALADPVLELHDGQGNVIAANDNWKDSQRADIQATGIPPSDDRESAILGNLSPGAYTAILRGKDEASGVGLVELYSLP